MANKLLTIGIPTYKREKEILNLLHYIAATQLYKEVEVLLIDDGPSPQLLSSLDPFMHFLNFHQHEKNQGYARTFCELFLKSSTPFTLITSDDDNIIGENIERAIDFLKNNQIDFASTQWLKGNKIHRGISSFRKIGFNEIGQASIHAPGLIYKTEEIKQILPFLIKRLDNNCQATFFLPQVVVLYFLFLTDKKCFWTDFALIKEGASLHSNLADKSGNSYFSLNGRWSIYNDFLTIFTEMKDFIPRERHSVLNAYYKIYEQKAFDRILFVIKNQYNDKFNVFMAGAAFELAKRPLNSFKLFFDFMLMKLKIRKILKHL